MLEIRLRRKSQKKAEIQQIFIYQHEWQTFSRTATFLHSNFPFNFNFQSLLHNISLFLICVLISFTLLSMNNRERLSAHRQIERPK